MDGQDWRRRRLPQQWWKARRAPEAERLDGLADKETAPMAVEGTHRSLIPAVPTPPLSSSLATSSRVLNDAAAEATGEHREEGAGGVIFAHIDKSAVMGCECLMMLLKGRLSVHDCRVLCCYNTNLSTLSSLDIFSISQGFKVLFQCRIFSRPAKFLFFVRSERFF